MSNIQLFVVFLCTITGLCIADPETVYGKSQSSVIFLCPFRNTSIFNIRWQFVYNTSIAFSMSEGPYIAKSNPSHARVSIVGDHTAGEYNLQLSQLQETDEGVYRCLLGLQQTEYKLELLAAPSSLTVQDVTIDNKILGTEGQILTLKCTATGGKPPPLVTITVDNVARSSNQTVQYTIPILQRRHDRQMVHCNANSAPLEYQWNITASLYLHLKPLQPIFLPKSVSTEDTKPLVVSCTSTGSRPAAIFQWIIGLVNATSYSTIQSALNPADDTYTVTSTFRYIVDRTYNGQTISCGAYNNVSSSAVVASTTLDVKFAPNITVTNTSFNQNTGIRTVMCNPDGNPITYTYYRWQHKSTYGLLIRELDGGQNGVLTLPSVPKEARYQDSGEYVCTASNGIKNKDGMIQQTGSGYVTVNAMPEFTNGNKIKEYGEFGKDVDIHVYVYSRPKYTSLKWYKTTAQISMTTSKYTLSEAAAVVTVTFHGTMLQLDGYRVTLTIKNLLKSDLNVNYNTELYNGVGQPVVYTTSLVSASHPQTPSCFIVPNSSESSVLIQWEPGDNGGHEQTFYAEYRELESNTWLLVKIPDTKQTGRQNYTLNGLQDGTLYELRMYAENQFNKSLPTEIIRIKTIKDCRLSSSEAVMGGVAGGLSAVIVILIIIIVVLTLRKPGTRKQRSTAQTSRWTEETSYHNYIDCKETDEQEDTQAETDKLEARSAQEYESLSMKDNPNTYSQLLTQQDTHKTRSAPEYETLGMTDSPNTYSELHDEQDQKQSDNTTDLYESLSDKDKSTVCPTTKAQSGPSHSEYSNLKM